MIADIVPPPAAAAEAFDDRRPAPLFPAEEEVIRHAVAARRREFATVRHCARRALATLGLAPVALVPGDRGAPTWPPAVVGSMTHCAGYRAAVVARADHLAGLGIDAEPDRPLPEGVLRLVSQPEERRRLDELFAEAPGPNWDRLLFCAKEALYKAWFPLTRRWLAFADATVTLSPAGTFTATVLVPGARVGSEELTVFRGRWLARDELLLAAVAVGAPPPAVTTQATPAVVTGATTRTGAALAGAEPHR